MALKDAMRDALNEQINHEFFSSYLYLAMAAKLDDLSLPGASSWMRMQAIEEQQHAMRFYDYILERGSTIKLMAIDAPEHHWENILEIFMASLEHEELMTKRLNALMDMAIDLRDHPTSNMMQWYVDEQVEEESTLNDIIPQLEMVGNKGSGLFMIDRELGARPEPTPPPAK